MFKIHADLDGYLEDPVFGPLNEKIYGTILDVCEPDYSVGRLYRLNRTPFQVLRDAYRQLNKIILERHPEESFKSKYLRPLKDEYDDSHYANLVFSVVYVVFSVLGTKQSPRMMSAIERCMAADADYFPVFSQLASDLESSGFVMDINNTTPMPPDWHLEYIKLNERYNELQRQYDELRKDENNQFNIDFPQNASNQIIYIDDLIKAATEVKTTNIFQALRYYYIKTQGDMVEYVKAKEELFASIEANQYSSNLAFSSKFKKIDIIRVFRALFDAGKIVTRNGEELTLVEYYKTIGEVFNIDLSDASIHLTNSLNELYPEEKHVAIFKYLMKVFQDQHVKKKENLS